MATTGPRTATGTATVTLVDLNGTLDPTNASGRLYGKLDPQATLARTHPPWTPSRRARIARRADGVLGGYAREPVQGRKREPAGPFDIPEAEEVDRAPACRFHMPDEGVRRRIRRTRKRGLQLGRGSMVLRRETPRTPDELSSSTPQTFDVVPGPVPRLESDQSPRVDLPPGA
jgi:hypothetical protein